MTFGIGFILLLLALGGFAAYQGDRVGMSVGRKRLTIFGLRPKYTSRVITVLTGIIIVSITMASVLLISHTARQSLFGLEDLQQQISDLSKELTSLQDRQRQLLIENSELQDQNLEMSSENELLLEQNEALRRENAELIEERSSLEADLANLEAVFADAKEDFEYKLDYSGLVWEWLMRHPLVYTSGQVIDSYVIDVPDGREALREQVRAMLEQLNAKVLSAGAGELPDRPGWALMLEYNYYVPDGGEGDQVTEVTVTEEERIDELVDMILATGLDSVVVQVFSLTHSLETFQVYPDWKLLDDRLIFPAGGTVDSRVFNGRDSGRDLFNQVWAWLEVDVKGTAIDKGLLARPDGTITAPLDPGLLYEVVETIRSYNGPVRVHAVASKPVRTNDELPLAFVFEEIPRENE